MFEGKQPQGSQDQGERVNISHTPVTPSGGKVLLAAGDSGILIVSVATLRSDLTEVTSVWGHRTQAGLASPPGGMEKLL